MKLFYALLPGEACQQALEGAMVQLRPYLDGGRYTEPQNLHLTLVFLGETDDEEGARRCLEALKTPRFTLSLSGLGRFRRAEGDILWAGVQAAPRLQVLYQELCRCLRREGFALEERPYSPHVTLARQVRFRPNRCEEEWGALLKECSLHAEAVSLMCSQRVNGRLQYTELARKFLR